MLLTNAAIIVQKVWIGYRQRKGKCVLKASWSGSSIFAFLYYLCLTLLINQSVPHCSWLPIYGKLLFPTCAVHVSYSKTLPAYLCMSQISKKQAFYTWLALHCFRCYIVNVFFFPQLCHTLTTNVHNIHDTHKISRLVNGQY